MDVTISYSVRRSLQPKKYYFDFQSKTFFQKTIDY